MLRISPVERGPRSVTLRLEGKIVDAWIAELGEACRRSLDRDEAVTLELSGVTFLDSAGAEHLALLHRQGVRLEGGSHFLLELLGRVAGLDPTAA